MDIEPKESEAVLKAYFKHGLDGPLSSFPSKYKKQLIILRQLALQFEEGRIYTEKEVNTLLKERHPDFAMLRRALVDSKHLERETDGSRYWVKR